MIDLRRWGRVAALATAVGLVSLAGCAPPEADLKVPAGMTVARLNVTQGLT